jgi:hypothetical protein
MHRLDHGYKITARAKHRREDIDPGLAASSDIWREWEKMGGRWRVESNTSTKRTRARAQVQSSVPIPSPILCQSPSPHPVPNPIPAFSPGPDPVESNPRIRAHTGAQRQSTTDTERLDRRYSGTSVLSNDIDISTMNWYVMKHKEH